MDNRNFLIDQVKSTDKEIHLESCKEPGCLSSLSQEATDKLELVDDNEHEKNRDG